MTAIRLLKALQLAVAVIVVALGWLIYGRPGRGRTAQGETQQGLLRPGGTEH